MFCRKAREREFFIDNLLVRIHFIIEMIWWTGLAPWEFLIPFVERPCFLSDHISTPCTFSSSPFGGASYMNP